MKLWDVKAPLYDWMRRLPLIRSIFGEEKRCIIHLLDRLDRRPRIVLDLGTGTGTSIDCIPVSTIIGIDDAFSMIRKSSQRGIVGVNADACCLPVKSQSVDFVCAIGLTEYIADTSVLLREMRRVIQPGGLALITISHPRLLNRFRGTLGHRLYLRQPTVLDSQLKENGFFVEGRERTLLMTVYLMKLLETEADSII